MKAYVYTEGINFETENGFYQSASSELIAEYDGDEALNLYWWYNFNKLSQPKQDLIRLLGNTILTGNKAEFKANNGKWITPELLYSICLNRLAKTELLKPCSRCCGTGHYSRNSQGSTICYKCKGYKFEIPTKYTKKLIKDIKEKNIEL